ncbi:hypothetical protein GEMRC1_007278 [Eukaryota sp. GEM-RC1]
MLEYLKKLKPESISAALKKSVDFKQITSLSELIQESYSLLTTHLEHSSRLKSVEHLQRQERPQSSRNNSSRNRNFSRSPIRSPRSNPSPYPATPRSNFSSPTTPKFSTPRSSPNTPDKSSITCFNCNKIGHYANECRSSPARRPYNPRNPTMLKNHNFRNRNTAKVSQPINAPKAHISSLLSDSDSDSPKYSRTSAKGLFQVSQKSPLLELDVLVGQRKVRGLIDTGCIKSCITSDLVDPTHGTIDKSKVSEFEVADGRIVRSLGRFHTELSLLMGNESPKRIHLEVKLPILEGSNQLLIGCDILKCLGLLTSEGLSIRINEKRNTLLTAEDDFDHLIQSPPKAASTKEPTSSFDECRIELPPSTKKKLLELLKSKEDAFGPPHPDGIDAPPMSLEYHDESSIVNKPPRKINPARLEIANGIFDELTSAGFAEEVPTDCPYGSPIVLVTYDDHRKPRLTGDYSGADGVNAKSVNVEANLPRISDIIEFLSNANFIATLDLPRAFWQLKIRDEDFNKTTLKIPGRAVRFTRAAFGLKNVPAVFQNTMVEIFKNIPNVFIYLDDIIIAAQDEESFLLSLKLILDQCIARRVKLGKKKCSFVTSDSEVKILGSIFQKGTRRIDQDRINAILDIPIPTNIHELRSFIGSINYIRDWLPNISKRWTPKHTKCFKDIKELIANSISLDLPQPNEALIISTDASEYAVSGVIWRQLTPSDSQSISNFADLKLAPVFLLLNRKLKLYCDHKNLAYLLTAPEKSRIVKRSLPTLCALDFEVFHVDGESNLFADLLSRLIPKEMPEAVLAKTAINASQSWPKAGYMSDLVLGPAQAKLRAAELVVKSCQPRVDSEGDRDTVRITKLTPVILEEDKFLPCLVKGCSGVVIDHWLSSDLYLLCCEQCSVCMSPTVYNDAALLLKSVNESPTQDLDRRWKESEAKNLIYTYGFKMEPVTLHGPLAPKCPNFLAHPPNTVKHLTPLHCQTMFLECTSCNLLVKAPLTKFCIHLERAKHTSISATRALIRQASTEYYEELHPEAHLHLQGLELIEGHVVQADSSEDERRRDQDDLLETGQPRYYLKSLNPIRSPESKIPNFSPESDLNLEDSSFEISSDEERDVIYHAKTFKPRVVSCTEDLLSASTDTEDSENELYRTPMSFLTPLRYHTPITVCQEEASPPFVNTLDPRKTRADASSVLRRSPDPLFYAPSASLFPQTMKTLKESRADWMSKLQAAQKSNEDEEFVKLIDNLTEEGHVTLEERLDLYLYRGKIIVPRNLRNEVLLNIHGLPHCGHPNLSLSSKVLETSDYWWPEAKQDLIEHLKSCPSCQKNAPAPKARDIPSTGNLIANRPFESLHVDTIGPLPKDIQGNVYVVVFVDSFSRFTVLVPLAKLNATEVAYAMLEKVCAIFGVPAAVHSDNGPEYANHIFEELCDFLNISISTSIPHFHQSNGVAERRNRDVLFTLRKLLADFNDYDNWSGYLPMTQLLINCQKCRRTGYTPFELIFGTESTIDPRSPPTKILDKLTNSRMPENSWLRTVESVSASLIEKWEKAETNSNAPILPQSEDALHQFKEGSYALRIFDRTAKLHSPWKGPYLITKVYSNRNHVKLLNLLTGAETLAP